MSVRFRAEKGLGAFTYSAALDAADEIMVLFGHSGAGKSLTLQFIAGLMRPDSGAIAIDGRTMFDEAAGIDVAPQARNVGYVVQDLALFRHMTVAENVAFGLPRGRDRERRVAELLELFSLEGFEKRRPATLSGGQQQRVALARALAREGRVLLLDEPFSALDDTLRANLRRELLRLRADLGLTILFVTHDLREAHLLADRLAVFDEGRLLQCGQREDVFRRPASRRVAELTGVSNILSGAVIEEGLAGSLCVDVAGTRLRVIRPPGFSAATGASVSVMIRAERVNLRREVGPGEPVNALEAVVEEELAYGSSHTLRFAPCGPGPRLEVELAARPYDVLGVRERRRWWLELPPDDLHVTTE